MIKEEIERAWKLLELDVPELREIGAHTVFHIADAWMSTVDNAKNRPELLALIDKIGVKAASDMGLIKRHEALTCHIITRRGENAQLCWLYDRDENDHITMGEREERVGPVEGKFSHYFKE
jgi:hypothetical protein